MAQKSRRVLRVEAQYFAVLAVILFVSAVGLAAAGKLGLAILGLLTGACFAWVFTRKRREAEAAQD
jgi:hypothetical protein